jgi:hypothetical protein
LDAALVLIQPKSPRTLIPTSLPPITDSPRCHKHQIQIHQHKKEQQKQLNENKLQISDYKNKHRKKPKPNLTPKKIKTIFEWTKQDKKKTNEYKQKLTHLDTGWGNIPNSKDKKISE